MKNLSKYVALDSNVFIYYLDKTSQFYSLADLLIKKIVSGEFKAATSTLSLAELLSPPIPEEGIKKLEREFSEIPNINIQEVTLKIAKIAARIRREYNFKLPDSIQLATALEAKAQAFITNNSRLKNFKELKVLTLRDLK